jgi:hypothetical protein
MDRLSTPLCVRSAKSWIGSLQHTISTPTLRSASHTSGRRESLLQYVIVLAYATVLDLEMAQVVWAGLIMSCRNPQDEGTLVLMKKLDDLIFMFEDAASRGSGRATHGLVRRFLQPSLLRFVVTAIISLRCAACARKPGPRFDRHWPTARRPTTSRSRLGHLMNYLDRVVHLTLPHL